MKTTEKIKQMIINNTPFAIMQYYSSFKGSKKETIKEYELIYINKEDEIDYILLNNNDVNFIKNNDKIKLIIENKDGRIYEFNHFKKYKESKNIKH